MTFKEKYEDHSTEIYKGDLDISKQKLSSLEGCYKEVKGNFWCDNNELTSLKGAPKKVGMNFNCSHNNLDSLEDTPKTVNANFYCSYNNLTSLKYGPKVVNGNFYCIHNNLTSLESTPKVINGDFDCSENPKLKSLDALLGIEIKGRLSSDIMNNKEFKEDQKIYLKVYKNLGKFKKLKKLLQTTKV